MAGETPALQGERAMAWRGALRHAPLLAGVLLIAAAIGAVARKIALAANWPANTDLSVYLNAAGAILHGEHPYDPSLYPYDPYGYPPLFAEAIAALRTVLGTGHLWLVWPIFCAACLVGAIWLITQRFTWKAPLGWVAIAAGVIMLGHIGRSDLYHGQPDFLLLLLFVAGLLQFERGKTVSGALAWGLMIVCKPFLGAVVFFLMRRGQWRDTAATLAASASLFFGSFLLFAPNVVGAVRGWMDASRWYTSLPNVAKGANETFYGLFTRLFVDTRHSQPWVDAPGLVPWLMLPILALVIAGIFFGIAKTSARSNADESGARLLIEASLPLGLFMALGPLTEAPHLYLLLPAIYGAGVIFARRWRSDAASKNLWAAAAASWCALLALFAIPLNLYVVSPYQWGELSGPGILISGLNGAIVLAACLFSAAALRADRKVSTEPVR